MIQRKYPSNIHEYDVHYIISVEHTMIVGQCYNDYTMFIHEYYVQMDSSVYFGSSRTNFDLQAVNRGAADAAVLLPLKLF